MGKEIEAVYEKGILRPLERIELMEGEIVKIEIKEKRIGESFYRTIEELEKRAPKVLNAVKILEEVRNDRY